MTFHGTLEKHLQAIQDRDLVALADTIALDRMVLITADGRLVTSSQEYLTMRREWFATPGWTLEILPVQVFEGPSVAVVVLRIHYREEPEGKPPTQQESFLTLTFQEQDERWEMVHEQCTLVGSKS